MGAVMIAVAVVMIADLDLRFENAIARHLPSALVDPTSRIEQSSGVSSRLADLRGGGPVSHQAGAAEAAAGKTAAGLFRAPDFTGTQRWFNTPDDRPLSLSRLRGRVVLVDFWTYTCINCIRTLPYIEAWYRRYHHDGFTVVGVHTPEFPFEKEASNVERAIGGLRPHLPGRPGQRLRDLDRLPQPVLAGRLPDRRHRKGPLRALRRGRLRGDRAGDPQPAAPRPGRGELGGMARAREPTARPARHARDATSGAARADRFANGADPPGHPTFPALPAGELSPDQLAYGGRWAIAERGRHRRAARQPGAALRRPPGLPGARLAGAPADDARAARRPADPRLGSPAPTSTARRGHDLQPAPLPAGRPAARRAITC